MSFVEAAQIKRHPHRVRLAFDPKDRFPDKLYAVACDSYMIKWSKDGTAVTVGEERFEKEGMLCYPGFVQIPTFVNLRRLFREYSFTWSLVDEDNLIYEFAHPMFSKDCIEGLANIKTKRKSYPESAKSRNTGGIRGQSKKPPKRSIPDNMMSMDNVILHNGQLLKYDPQKMRRCDFEGHDSNSTCGSQPYDMNMNLKVENKERYNDLMNTFARNEMNVTEYEQYLRNKNKTEVETASSNIDAESSNDAPQFSTPSVNQSAYIMVNNVQEQENGQAAPTMVHVSESDIPHLQHAYFQQPVYKQAYDWSYQQADGENTSVNYSDNGQAVMETQAKLFGQCSTFQPDQGCSCCKHCKGCHHHEQSYPQEQSYSQNQLGSGDSSISYYNL